jgi:hypothetical protein
LIYRLFLKNKHNFDENWLLLLQLLLPASEEEESSSFQDLRPWLWLVNGIIRV